MNLTVVVISLITYLVFLVVLGCAVYYWFFRRKYTRERFAFFGLTCCVTLTIGVITSIAGKAAIWEQIIILWHYYRKGEILQPSLEPIQSALSVFALFGVYFLVYSIFKTWDGSISKDTHLAQLANKDKDLERFIKESIDEINRLLNREKPIAEYTKPTISPKLPNLGNPRKSLSWNYLARDLLRMNRNALRFNNWRTPERFWLAEHTDYECTVAIKCCTKMPETQELEKFVEYTSKMKDVPGELILAVQVDTVESQLQVKDKTIEVVSQNQLLDNLVNFTEYHERIKERVKDDYLSGSDLTLDKVYVKPRFRKGRDGDTVADLNIEKAINRWIYEPSGKQLAILGEYGQGKSSTALMLTYHLLEEGIENHKRIPILLELRGKSPRTMTRGELLGTWSYNSLGIHPRHLEALDEAGRLLFIFDGFDEMALVGNQYDRLKHFQTLWSFNHSKAKIIFTGRPNLFLDDNELKAALGIQKGSAGTLICEEWYLEKFNIQEIAKALRNTPIDIRESIVKAVDENKHLLDIASRPSLLHVISRIWNKDLSERANELTSSELINDFLQATLKRQTEKARELQQEEIEKEKIEEQESTEVSTHENNAKNYMVLNAHERYYFMLGISVHMMKKDESNQILIDDLNEIIEKLAKVCPEKLSLIIDPLDCDRNQPIKQHIEESEDFLGKLQDDVRTCGLLVKDCNDRAFKFGHKSFLEYLAAEFAQRSFSKNEDDEIEIDSILIANNVDFKSVLINSVTRRYFGELLLWKNNISQQDKSNISLFFLTQLLQPSRLRKLIWNLSVRIVHNNSKKYLGINFLIARYILSEFSLSKYDNLMVKRSFLVGLSMIFLLLYTVLLILISYWDYLLVHRIALYDYYYQPIDWIIALFTFMLLCIFIFTMILFLTTRNNLHNFAKIWIDVCKELGCKVEHMYAALDGRLQKSEDYNNSKDPIGIFTPQKVEEKSYEMMSEIALHQIISDPASSSWNRGVAAWVLAYRHSEFGKILFSKYLNGKIPGRDPHLPIDKKTIQKVSKQLDLSRDEMAKQFQSLNDSLGWDLRKGFIGSIPFGLIYFFRWTVKSYSYSLMRYAFSKIGLGGHK